MKLKTKILLKTGGLALLLAGTAFGTSTIIGDAFGQVVLNVFFPLLLLLAIFFATVIFRIRVFGRLPSDLRRIASEIDPRLPLAVLRPARLWAIFKIGIVGAVAILLIGSIISGVAGTGIRHGVYGFVYLTLLMMIGNLIVGSILNVEIAKLGRSPKHQD